MHDFFCRLLDQQSTTTIIFVLREVLQRLQCTMSSRWDALKPSNSSNNSASGSSEKQRVNYHGSRKKKEYHPSQVSSTKYRGGRHGSHSRQPPPASQQTQSGVEYRKTDSSWRTGGRALKLLEARQSEKDDVVSNAAANEWNKLTKELAEWGNRPTHQAVGANKNGPPDQKSTTASEIPANDFVTILRSLSRLTGRSQGRSRISGTQRGTAIATALDIINVAEEEGSMTQILKWVCEMLQHSTSNQRKRSGGIPNTQHSEDDGSTAIHVSNMQARKCIQSLIHAQSCIDDHHYCKATIAIYHKCCMRIMICLAPQFPPEETAHEMVGRILLPLLESNLGATCSGIGESEARKQMLLLGFQAIQSLLQVKNHASALLAPLVKDVDANGQELYLVNPLRKRLFQLFQKGLQMSLSLSLSSPQVMSIDLTAAIYRGLATTLQAANAVDKPTSAKTNFTKQLTSEVASESATRDLDVLVMERFFKDMFRREEFLRVSPVPMIRQQVLVVLLAFLKHQPDAALSMGSILLLREHHGGTGTDAGLKKSNKAKGNSICPCCGYDAYTSSLPAFLDLLHVTRESEESDLLMMSLAMMVTRAPWKLWMGKKLPEHQRQGGAASNFSIRVSETLLGILRVATCLLQTQCEEWRSRATTNDDSLLSLLNATLLGIPYESCSSSTEGKRAVEAASDMFAILSNTLVHESKHQYAPLDRLTELFEESMGGRITPQGSRTRMIAPARRMLSSPSSRPFLDEVFNLIETVTRRDVEKTATLAKIPVKLLRSILRTHPETVLDHEADWERYRRIIENLCMSDTATLPSSGLELLEALLHGRQHDLPPGALSVSAGVLVNLVLKLLPQIIQSQPGSCRRLCFQAYGSLLESDWLVHLNSQEVGSMKHHIELILHHCVASEQVSAVRSAACKAIGDVCSRCFLYQDQPECPVTNNDVNFRGEQLEQIGLCILARMQVAMKDDSAPVRSMAVFAIGNLAQVSVCSQLTYDPQTFKNACLAVFNCIGDENEKVSSNAIRSVGHLATVALRGDCAKALNELDWEVDEFCARVVTALTDKVDTVPIILRVVESGSSTLSWKQRSTVKKHGRVACNTLALLLKHWSIPEGSLAVCQNALGSVVKCIQCLGTSLDQKVIMAAMAALQALSSSSLARVSGKSALVGNALVACVCFIARESWSKGSHGPTGKLFIQVELLCQHLVNTASTFDASVVIACEDIADSWMEHLYDWMVQKKCSVSAFDAFALALQKPGLRVPVTVEHKYANRAMNLFRNEYHTPDSDDEL